MTTDTFASWLDYQLRRREWNGTDLARRMEIEPSVVNRWLRGERIPSPKSCDRIADAMLLDADEVLAEAGHRIDSGHFEPGDPRRTIIALIEQLDPSDPTTLFWLESLPPTIEKLRKLDRKRGRSQ